MSETKLTRKALAAMLRIDKFPILTPAAEMLESDDREIEELKLQVWNRDQRIAADAREIMALKADVAGGRREINRRNVRVAELLAEVERLKGE